ncbi:MAG: hypothetical protein R8L07_14845 [Alphaproteobacteria bacterium]|nr:hypothetical protein [Alphaproteobacteria bacterium]
MLSHIEDAGNDYPWARTIGLTQARAVMALWQAMPMPKPRRNLDPLAFGGRVLPHLNLLRRVGQGHAVEDVRYDLVGGVVDDAVPRLRPGAMALHGAGPDNDRIVFFRFYSECLTRQMPVFFTGQYLSESKVRTHLLCLCLPLDLREGGPAESILVGAWFLPAQGAFQNGPVGNFEEIPLETLCRGNA